MENELFLNTGGIPMQTMSTWQSLASSPSMEIQMNEQSPDCFFNPNWDKSTDHSGLQFDSALSSMVSSPAASNSNISNENFVIRELIGKLGNINNTSCYSTPLNSPPKLNLPIVDNFVKEKKLPSLGNSMALNSTVAEFSSDPGFAERAAKFSRFGSRSFNGRTKTTTTTAKTQFVNPEFGFRSGNHLVINEKFPRVSSSPSLKVLGSQVKGNRNPNNEMVNCPEETSSVSEQVMNTPESGLKCSNDFNNISRKRKAVPKGKSKEPSPSPDTSKMGEANDNWRNKRMKTNEGNGNENGASKKEEEQKGDGNGGGEEDDKQNKTSNNKNENTKPPEAPKDYIHVRARRGQATDSHSLAERVRREKISERMKLLQDLVPGCNKVTGKALMLDEIINYVQSLQRQVEFLSMKLASVNTRLDSSIDALVSKDMYEAAGNKGVGVTHPIFPIDSSATTLLGHLTHQNQPLHHINGSLSQCSASGTDPFDTTTAAAATTTSMFRNLNMHIPLHQLDQFADSIPQFQAFCEDDLQSIVQMGFGQNCNRDDPTLQSQSFHGQNQVSHTKMEL